MEQLAERTTQGRKHKDLRCLEQVMEELRQTRWLTPVSKAQIETVQKLINHLTARQFTIEAVALAQHIEDAFAANNNPRLALLIGRWRKIQKRVNPAALSEDLANLRSIIQSFDQDLRQQQEECNSQEVCEAPEAQSGRISRNIAINYWFT